MQEKDVVTHMLKWCNFSARLYHVDRVWVAFDSGICYGGLEKMRVAIAVSIGMVTIGVEKIVGDIHILVALKMI